MRSALSSLSLCVCFLSLSLQVGQGVSPRRALLWSIATCLPQPLVAIPSFMFVEAFTVGIDKDWSKIGACCSALPVCWAAAAS